jgi:hypothetical protein
MQPLYELIAIAGDLISKETIANCARRILDDLSTSALIKKRKGRSCQRGLRQPVKDWPKIKNPISEIIKKSIIITNP